MNLFTKLKKWIFYSNSYKKVLFEALVLSMRNEIFLRLNIYKPVKMLHSNVVEANEQNISTETLKEIMAVAKASKQLEKFAPWRPKCYNRALTAKQMLKKRNIDTQLHIGFRKKDGHYDGHAWVSYSGKVVTGNLPKLHSFKEFTFPSKDS